MFIADFHIHSSYSRATSRECVPEILELWARRKGLALIGTGDFTHPAWRAELKEKLIPAENGLYTLKTDCRQADEFPCSDAVPRFIVSGEISSIYKKNGKVRKVHNLILLPGLEAAETLSLRLEKIGNLHSDGRPILGLDSRDLLEITLETCPDAIFIPAHIWTPHFSLFGAYSGFDDIHECFEDLTGHIHALETGLSSDPPMNWRLSALDGYTLISNSDAHSPAKLAREANLFDTELSYPSIALALDKKGPGGFCGTIEFFPEEGKYHWDGHRNCKACFKPAETKERSGICPVCGGRITVGVLHRVETLADREEGFAPSGAPRFESLVPLHEVIAASLGMTTASGKVKAHYKELIHELGPELHILRETPLEEIERKAGPCIAEGIRRLRDGRVDVAPGYDGEYGKIKILDKSEIDLLSGQFSFLDPDAPQKTEKKKTAGSKKSGPETPKAGPGAGPKQGSADTPYGLNREQWEAASSDAHAVAVLAGPGTGKTRTLICRIAHLVEQCGVPPAQITAVTFTNKAAAEMRERLEKHFGDKKAVRAMTIGTFHSICLQILSAWQEQNAIADEYEAEAILGEILSELGIKKAPRELLQSISKLKNRTRFAKGDPDVPAEVWELYHERLKHFHLLDYDDILLRVLERFEGGTQEASDSFTHLLVDEFQDINDVQYRLIRAWSRRSAGIFVIGDPDQSIYGFRGSDSRCFERLRADLPDLKSVRLIQNYRSTPEILGCAMPVIQAGSGPDNRRLQARRESGSRVRILRAGDSFSEALFVVKEINRMVGGMDLLEAHASRGKRRDVSRGFSEIAVLYRTHRQAEILEECLQKEDIPYVIAGRDEFLMSREVRAALAFFRVLLNPADVFSLNECLKGAGIGPAVFRQKILDGYTREGIRSLCEPAGLLEPSFDCSGLVRLAETLDKYRRSIRREKPGILVENWINENGLGGNKNMERLLGTALLHNDMSGFLHNIALGRETDVRRSGNRNYTPDAVSLMTLHGSKGLEFPVVFLCGAAAGLIPLTSGVRDCDEDEERRLFYVGMTRAQDELVLMSSAEPSPFLADIPRQYSTTEAAAAPRRSQGRQLNLFDM